MVTTSNSSSKQAVHRPGLFKQQNKAHKSGRHRTKGQLDREAKGRADVKTLTKKSKRELQRREKRNRAQQIRKQKREEVMNEKRGLGGGDTPPILTTIISLHANVQSKKLVQILTQCDGDATVTKSGNGSIHISIPRFRQRFTFITTTSGDLYNILDSIKVSDTAVFIFDSEEGIDDEGDLIMSAVLAHGLPTPVFVTLSESNLSVKKKNENKKRLNKTIEKYSGENKLIWVEKDQDGILLLRHIGSQKRRHLRFRELRAHILAESHNFVGNEQDGVDTLLVRGYVRGTAPLSVYHLVHIPGVGDFQLKQIDRYPDPHPLVLKKGADQNRVETEVQMLMKADPTLLENLQAENEIDPMEGEQTWPTEEELMEAEEGQERQKSIKKRVPKGTSEYQASWILNSDDEDDDEDSDSDLDADMEVKSQSDSECSEEEETVELETSSASVMGDDEKYDQDLDMDEEEESRRRLKEAKDDEMFPDEIDTPLDLPARIRFQKFRGLSSFRTSPWDPKENLPIDYQRISTFQNFKGTRKAVFKENKNQEGAEVGWFVQLHIKDVPVTRVTQDSCLTLFSMLKHEQKMSVLNVVLKRSSQSHLYPPSTVRNKDALLFHVGYRRFTASPIFSEHTNGNKYKVERYFRPNSVVVATVYAPIVYPPATVLVFKQRNDGSQEFIACGSVLSVDPNRIILKRVILSGIPFKIHKRTAVIRHLFFNREDITYFKPVELKTKHGRRGHVIQPLGTHGHMKCLFDGQLKSQDTVLLTLYKRVFPKWRFDPVVQKPALLYSPDYNME